MAENTTHFELPYKKKDAKKSRSVLKPGKGFVIIGLVDLIFVGEITTYFLFQFRYWDISWITTMICFGVALLPCVIMVCLVARLARKQAVGFFHLLNDIIYR